MELDEIRQGILEATLAHVPFDGWSLAALAAGTRDAGFEPVMSERTFPGGTLQMIEAFSDWADRVMLERLESCELDAMKVRQRVAAGVRFRLHVLTPHREAARRALSTLSLPTSGTLGLRLLYRTVDAVWYAAGDSATDYNFYTKRALLAGVYGATSLYWLNDQSEDQADSWEFLDRRLSDVMQVPRVIGRLKEVAGVFPSPFRLARRLATARPRTGTGH